MQTVDLNRCSTVALWSVTGNYLPIKTHTINLCITLSHRASCQTLAEQDTMLHCLWDNEVFASYLERTRILRRRSSLLSTCVFIPNKPSNTQANRTVILVDYMLFNHTFISQMFTENINSVSVIYICTIRKKIQLERIQAGVH